MNKKIILGLLVLVLATSVVYAAAQDSQMEVKSPDKLKNGQPFNLTLTAKDGSPIANQVIDIYVIAESGEKNHINFTTDNDGKIGFDNAGVNPGKYTFNCTFNGTDAYNTCNLAKELTIEA
jgi:5-hydroxyisourate hydrolase-like protein (transthyretin family)